MEVRVAERRFYFWESYGKAFDMLTDEEAGVFIKACYRFAFEGVEPDFTDVPKLEFAWQIVSGQIARSVEIGVQRAQSGQRGGRKNKGKTKQSSALSNASSNALSDMNMNMNIGAGASPDGSAPAPLDDGDSDEY